MPTVILLVDGDGSLQEWNDPGTSHALEVDEGVAAADDDGSTIADGSTPVKDDFFTLDAVPGDFDVAVTFRLRMRTTALPMTDDTARMELELWNAAENAQIGALQTSHQQTAFGWGWSTSTSGTEANTDDAAAWNGYRLRMRKIHSAQGMPDGTLYEVTAIEVEVEYATAATPSFPNRIAGNMRQAVRRAMRRAA